PGGRFLYITSGDQIVIFERNLQTGQIGESPLRVEPALSGTEGIAIAPDGDFGSFVLTTGNDVGQVLVLDRELYAGTLSADPTLGAQLIQEGQNLELAGLRSLVTAPNGVVYGISPIDNALVGLDAQLNPLFTITNGVGGQTGMAEPQQIAIAGGRLYVVASRSGVVTVFDILPDGSLTNSRGFASGLMRPQTITVSGDGEHVYVGGADGIEVFRRNLTTGDLISLAVESVGPIHKLTINPDDSRVYAIDAVGDRLLVLDRDTNSSNPSFGRLTLVDTFVDNTDGVLGLASPSSLIVSANSTNPSLGNFVYVSSAGDNAISVFAVDDGTGAVSLVQTVRGGEFGVRGIEGASDLALVETSTNGSFLFVAGEQSDSLVVFRRDPIFGRLTFTQVLRNNTGGVSGLEAPQSLAVSADGSQVFVGSTLGVGSQNGGVAVFENFAATGTLPEPTTIRTSFSDMVNLTVETGNGDDTFNLRNAAPVLMTTLSSGAGQDLVIINDLLATTTVNLGADNDRVGLRSNATNVQ
ncbi:MAG: beta-propeller fold lactonase family protein, partial [Planctomycetaceae bacterium]|nr:beta-propeller fold lactonase family protein [Planctomycetaceae bacterium]